MSSDKSGVPSQQDLVRQESIGGQGRVVNGQGRVVNGLDVETQEVVDGLGVPDDSDSGALPQFQGQFRAVVHQSFEEFLPHPMILEGYEGVVPGAAERILRLVEESAEHQRTITTAALSAQTSDVRRGQWFAFLTAFGALAAGLVAILTGSPGTGATIISTTLAGGIGTFLYSRKSSESS